MIILGACASITAGLTQSQSSTDSGCRVSMKPLTRLPARLCSDRLISQWHIIKCLYNPLTSINVFRQARRPVKEFQNFVRPLQHAVDISTADDKRVAKFNQLTLPRILGQCNNFVKTTRRSCKQSENCARLYSRCQIKTHTRYVKLVLRASALFRARYFLSRRLPQFRKAARVRRLADANDSA